MARRPTKNTMPSWGALLGMLAIAGYQNRDKLMELLNKAKTGLDAGVGEENKDRMKEMADQIGQREAPDVITDAVKGVVEGMRKSSLGPIVDSWVGKGPNEPVHGQKLQQAVGQDLIDELARRTGLSKSELLKRLATDVPRLVDDMTPHGRWPS